MQEKLAHRCAILLLAQLAGCGNDNPRTASQARQLAASEQPGDDLPPSDDTTPDRSCGPATSPAGSQLLRVLPAGPRRADGTLAFTPGVCVYLPPGYASSGKRYPVIYWFHGGGGTQSIFHPELLDAAYARNPDNAVIMVGPDASGLATWFDRFDDFRTNPQTVPDTPNGTGIGYRRTLTETYVLHWVLPYIDQHFRTIATREGRATFGISNGGVASTLYPAKAPELFASAATMSGNVAWQSFAGGSEMFLDPASGAYSPTYRAGNLAVNLAGNLDHVDMIFDIGTECPVTGQTAPACSDASWAFEQLFVQGNRDLQTALKVAGHAGTNDYREGPGGHSDTFWSQWFAERHLPFLLAHLADPAPAAARLATAGLPERFRYRSVASEFDTHDHHVSVARAAREFLGLVVDGEALTVQGSGLATITTPPRYTPSARYRISGSSAADSETVLTADRLGRLAIDIDLGPANPVEHDGVGDTGFLHSSQDPALDNALSVTRHVMITTLQPR